MGGRGLFFFPKDLKKDDGENARVGTGKSGEKMYTHTHTHI